MNFNQIMNNIEKIIKLLNSIRMDAYHKHRVWLKQTDAMAIDIFSLLDKATTVPLELLVYYKDTWKNPEHRQPEHDMIERVKVIMNMCFIAFLSMIEHFMKDCLSRLTSGRLLHWYQEEKGKSSHLSFYSLLSASKSSKIISESEFDIWNGARILRNSLVHNNGIGELDETWNINGTSVKFRKNKPNRYKLYIPAYIILLLSEYTRLWLERFLKDHIIK